MAYWAAWPTIHQDLTARHTWLRQWRTEHGSKVETDPDFYDVKVAGWWVWGLSNWIGGGWCADDAAFKKRYGSQRESATARQHRPEAVAGLPQSMRITDSGGAKYLGDQGVQAQRGGQGKRIRCVKATRS